MRPGKLALRVGGECDIDPGHLIEVYAAQRQRFISILAGFGPADWAAPTRCAEWSAHQVVRHLCDVNGRVTAAAPDSEPPDAGAPFDARVTPREWLTATDGETPDATLARFKSTSLDMLEAGRAWLAEGRSFDVRLPYGSADWTVQVLHVFWDSWIHERDVLLARGAGHPSSDDATAYAIAYGVFIAAVIAARNGGQVQETLTLGGPGGGTFAVDTSGGVTVTASRGAASQDTASAGTASRGTASRATRTGAPAALVADALAGRGRPLAELLPGLPAGSQAALSTMARYFNTPA
jgi:uncharacterized protein (TIGR03083 family)